MSQNRTALTGERRVVTALFCDIVGSTALAEEMDPEDWSELVGVAISTMGEVIAAFGGTISEFGGDGVVAIFGAPTAHEDDPYRAARSGLEIVKKLRGSLGQPLDVRVGIHTGLVVAGDIEAGALNTFSALGDTVNVAARLQTLAEPGAVVISEETRRLLGTDVEVHSLGPAELKGRSAPVQIHEVIDVKGVDERSRGLPGLNSPMVGREGELQALKELVSMTAAGTGRAAAVIGEPGVGKSRLLRELKHEVLDGDSLWAVGTCVPYDDELPYHLAASLTRSMAGVGISETPEVTTKAIQALAESLELDRHTTALLRLSGLESEYEESDPEGLLDEYATALIDVISALAREHRPLALVCEDTHWADASSVDLISRLIDRVPSMRVMLLLLMRPDRGSGGWQMLENARRELAESFTEITLDRLDEEESRTLVSNLLEVDSLPTSLRQLVLDKAEGNPFFLEEIVRMLVDASAVQHRDGRWVGKGDIDRLEVPGTIQGLLASRIDLLEPQLRKAGRVASVIGRRFQSNLFDAVYGSRPREEWGAIHPDLASLESKGMIRLEEIEPELEFEFRHALIHDVMYEGLLRRERREIHGSVAEAIEGLYSERLDEMAPALARHYSEAGEHDKAVSYYLTSGRRALERGARVEAAGFFGHAQEMLEGLDGADPRDLIRAVIGRVTAGSGFIPLPDAIRWIESVLPKARDLDDPDLLARLYERLLWARTMQGESHSDQEFRSQLETGYALIPRLSDPGVAALLHAMMGGALRSADEYESSIGPLSKAVEGLEAQGRLSEASYNASMLADSLSRLGRFDEAVEAVERARELGERGGDPNSILDADIIRGSIAAERGELEEALEYTRRGIAGAEEHGNTFCNLAGNFKLADQQLRLGQVDSAISHLEKSTELAQYCNAGGYEVLGQAWLAMARSRAGDPRPEDFDDPLAKAIDSGSRSMEGLVRLQRAIALAHAGEFERARPDFERAIELFTDYGDRPNVARAQHAYGQALEASGQVEQAVTRLEAAEELFTELGIRSDTSGVGAS